MNKLTENLESSKKWLIFSLIATLAWGLVAHGYGFLHSNFSADSLSEFSGAVNGNAWKVQLGRIVVPAYRMIFRTSLTLPWMVGLLSLLWIGLAVFFTVRMFDVESKGIAFLIAGIFATNITVSAAAATYMHDYDCDMFALLCAVAAVYLWKNVRWGELGGAVCIALSLGIYQSYILVAVVLVMFVCILDLLNAQNFRTVLVKGLRAIGMLLLGGVLYYVLMQLVFLATGITLTSGDAQTASISDAVGISLGSLPSLILRTYLDCISRLLNVTSPYPEALVKGLTVALALVCAAALIAGLCSKRVSWLAKLLCIALVGLLPLAMNLLYIPTDGIVHDLMTYAIWLFYLLALLLGDWLVKFLRRAEKRPAKQWALPRIVSMAMIFVILYGNVQTANVLYLKKDLEQEAFLSLMTRIVYRMEDCDEYEPGVTPVVFVGNADQLNEVIPGFEDYQGITGMDSSRVVTTSEDYRVNAYFRYVLGNPAVFADMEVWNAMQTDPRAAQMPAYPADGCLAMIDGVLVVKVGD